MKQLFMNAFNRHFFAAIRDKNDRNSRHFNNFVDNHELLTNALTDKNTTNAIDFVQILGVIVRTNGFYLIPHELKNNFNLLDARLIIIN